MFKLRVIYLGFDPMLTQTLKPPLHYMHPKTQNYDVEKVLHPRKNSHSCQKSRDEWLR